MSFIHVSILDFSEKKKNSKQKINFHIMKIC